LLLLNVIANRDVNQGGFPMTSMSFARGLSVAAAYLAFALVGAIVLGVI
jgi:hypothetical protein